MDTPTKVALVTVVKSQKDRYSPITKGMINAMKNAISVGPTNRKKYFFMDLFIRKPPYFAASFSICHCSITVAFTCSQSMVP